MSLLETLTEIPISDLAEAYSTIIDPSWKGRPFGILATHQGGGIAWFQFIEKVEFSFSDGKISINDTYFVVPNMRYFFVPICESFYDPIENEIFVFRKIYYRSGVNGWYVTLQSTDGTHVKNVEFHAWVRNWKKPTESIEHPLPFVLDGEVSLKAQKIMTQDILVPGTVVRSNDGVVRKVRLIVGNSVQHTNRDPTVYIYRDTGLVPFCRAGVKEIISVPDFKARFLTRDDQVKNKILKLGDRVIAVSEGSDKLGTIININISNLLATGAEGNTHPVYTILFDDGVIEAGVLVCNVHFLLNSAGDEMSTSDKNKSETNEALILWKNSAIRGLYKGTARQFVSMSKNGVFMFVKNKSPDTYKDIEKYINNKYVDGVFSGALGALLTHAPFLKDHPQAQKVAEELRSDSFSNVYEEVFELATKKILPLLMGGLEALNNMESKVLAAQTVPSFSAGRMIDTSMVDAEAQESARQEFEQSLSAAAGIK